MNEQEKFSRAMYFVEISEGGTNDDPDDRGGFTKYGICTKQYPLLDIRNLTHDTARMIYYEDYWCKNKCDSFKPELAGFLFDSSVNCGAPSAAKWLQQAINVINGGIVVDGIIGLICILP